MFLVMHYFLFFADTICLLKQVRTINQLKLSPILIHTCSITIGNFRFALERMVESRTSFGDNLLRVVAPLLPLDVALNVAATCRDFARILSPTISQILNLLSINVQLIFQRYQHVVCLKGQLIRIYFTNQSNLQV